MPACLAKRFRSVNSGRYFGLVHGSIAPSFSVFDLVRNHQIKIEIDGVAEALAARAGSVGIVEREQPRLRLLVAQVAVLAFKALREAQVPCGAGTLARFCVALHSGISKMTSPDSR